MLDGREPISVTLPADVTAAREVYRTNPIVNQIVNLNARDEDVDPDEYLCTVAGGKVSATAAELGLVGATEPDMTEVSITGTFTDD